MFFNVMFLIHMSITSVGQESDGTYNYLLESASNLDHKYISLSSKQVIPTKIGENFLAKFKGECSEMWNYNTDKDFAHLPDSWLKGRNYICSAESVQTSDQIYYDITYEKPHTK